MKNIKLHTILLAGGAVILDENVAQQDIQNELVE